MNYLRKKGERMIELAQIKKEKQRDVTYVTYRCNASQLSHVSFLNLGGKYFKNDDLFLVKRLIL
jgi:hypothetical protein